jgi:hypothetical protein
MIPHSVGADATISRGQDVIVWRHCAASIKRIMGGDNPVSDTTVTQINSEMKSDVVKRIWHLMTKVHDISEISQGSRNLRATQKDTCTQSQQMTAVGYNLHMEGIVKAFWSFFQHNGVVAFKLSR